MSLGVARICVVVGRTRHKMVAVEMQEAVRRGAQFMELRLDFLAKAVDFKRLLPFKGCPTVATVRRPSDGGRWPGTEEARKMLLRQAIVSGGFEWVDLETDIADEIRRFGTVKRIVSYHNINEAPEDLEAIYEKMCQQDADVLKIAVTAQSPLDNVRVLKLLQSAKRPTVAHCMGEMGLPSRFLSLKYGAPFVYAAFNKERGVAPGLPSFDDLRNIYHVESIGPDTKVFGVVGDPVGHSFSPLLHNKAFRAKQINAIYLPFRVPRGQLPATLQAFDMVPVSGYSVTIPHKEAAAQLAQQADDTVRISGAANTLLRLPEGGFRALNTDYSAALDSLLVGLAARKDAKAPPLEQMSALILGAGGVARAVVYALHRRGVRIALASRTTDRAARLAEEVGGKCYEWVARHQADADILINCTPVGMHPNVDESPIHASYLKPGLIVFDTVYTPETTLLIREAQQRGCIVVTGVEMFVRQAAAQFEQFTQTTPDLEAMRQTLRRALSPVMLREDDDDDADE